jgi:hypothetical protein
VHPAKDSVDQFATTLALTFGCAQLIQVGKDLLDKIFNLRQKFALRLIHGRNSKQ